MKLLPAGQHQEPQKARLLLKPKWDKSRIVTIDGPAMIGRKPDRRAELEEVRGLWVERLRGKENRLYIMPSIEAFIGRVLDIYSKTTVWITVPTEEIGLVVSRMHLMFFPPDEQSEDWRVMDTLSFCGTRLVQNERKVLMEFGRTYPIQKNDGLIIASEGGERFHSPLTARFIGTPECEGKYYALVVSNPEGDDASRTIRARSFKSELERRHFTVKMLSEKVSAAELEDEFDVAAGICAHDSLFLFAYTGHINKEGAFGLWDGGYHNSRLFGMFENNRGKKIAVIDGCYSHQFAAANLPERTAVVTSTNTVMSSMRGVLTDAFVKCLEIDASSFAFNEGFRKRLEANGYFVELGQKPEFAQRGSTIHLRSRLVSVRNE